MNIKLQQYEVLSKVRKFLPSVSEIARVSNKSRPSVQNVIAGVSHNRDIISVITSILIEKLGTLPKEYTDFLDKIEEVNSNND